MDSALRRSILNLLMLGADLLNHEKNPRPHEQLPSELVVGYGWLIDMLFHHIIAWDSNKITIDLSRQSNKGQFTISRVDQTKFTISRRKHYG